MINNNQRKKDKKLSHTYLGTQSNEEEDIRECKSEVVDNHADVNNKSSHNATNEGK